MFEQAISEIQVKNENLISSGALACGGFWNISVHIFTQNRNPVAVLRSFDDGSNVKTRISQYKALKNGKGLQVAKEIVLAKLEGYNQLLKKHGLRQLLRHR